MRAEVKKTVSKWAIGATVVMMVATTTVASTTPRYRIRVEHVGPGVTLKKILDRNGPNRIRVLEVDPTKRVTFDVALATDVLPGHEQTTSMARRHNALAAINGDFTLLPGSEGSGRPVNTFIEDSHLKASPLIWGRNFSISRDELTARVGHSRLDMWMTQQSGESWEIASVNPVDPDPYGVSMYTAAGGKLFRPQPNSCAARLLGLGRAGMNGDLEGFTRNFVVDKVACSSHRMKRRSGNVVSAPIGSLNAATLRTTLVPGEHVAFGWSFNRDGVLDTIGGNPDVVKDGRVVDDCAESTFCARHPRSGVGITPEGRILLVTVDGRMASSRGMTLTEFGRLFVYLGAESAMNLDGGGSTTMVVRDRIRNVPSGGYERPVGSALLVLPGRDRGELVPGPYVTPSPTPTPTPTPSPTPSETPTARAGDGTAPFLVDGFQGFVDPSCQALLDPASTGGMLDALARGSLGDRKLPRSLRWAVRVFRGDEICG